MDTSTAIPLVLCGPILRHISDNELTVWLVTSESVSLTLSLFEDDKSVYDSKLSNDQHQQVQVGQRAYIHLVSVTFNESLLPDQVYGYDLTFHLDGESTSLMQECPQINFEGQKRPSFVVPKRINRLLHGSCRKPHFDGEDGLVRVEQEIKQALDSATKRPSLLMMSGDQVYADDVAGPTLAAIHQVIQLLGLFDETLEGATVADSTQLYDSEYCYYHREKLLPRSDANKAVYEKFFAASKKPIFTSVNAKNHLVTLAECVAMYLLVWSPTLWDNVDFSQVDVAEKDQVTFEEERKVLQKFVKGLPQVSRALAHISTYMIFDDHDITDDWNLTRGWEEAAYGHPFSKRIIGNTLIAYLLCQGWGNAPEKFQSMTVTLNNYFKDGYHQQDELIEQLLGWQQWHFSLNTVPKIVVLDTRTQRWRSESKASKPSGLMDWEALSDMQQELINEPQVILVSAAPIYGVKMIETIQRIFTFFGQPLMVDAENWMAHSGTANVMLNIFRHVKTPPEFIILSGDVHYSFVYDVTHRFKRNESKIVQITSSGIKNQFPTTLLRYLDKLNRVFYASYSPLNWFTKRRRMKIKVRQPDNMKSNQSLVNACGIGEVTLTHDDKIVEAKLLTVNGEDIVFCPREKEDS